jgi:CheY-like chemotaxis protein
MASKRILVIESDEEFSESLVSLLSQYDVETRVIRDGKEGLNTAKEDPPDMILLCVELPKMSGYSICNKLKKDKRLKKVPLIIMSTEATEETFEQHKKLKTRAEDYIIKPFPDDDLLGKVNALMELPILESLDEEELITIDDDEAISIDDEEAISIEDLPDLEDENIDLEGDGSTVVMDSPEDGEPVGEETVGDDLENFDDVFDEIQMEDGSTGDVSAEEEPTASSDVSADDELAEFDDVLDSLKEVEAEEPTASAEPEQVEEIDLSAEEPVIEPEAPVVEEVAELEPVIEEEPPPAPALPAAAKPDPVLITKLQNAEDENKLLRDKVQTLESKLEEMHQSTEKQGSELGNLRTKTTSRDKETLALKATINVKDREILDLKEEVNRKDQDILDVQEKIGEREEEISRLQEMIAKRDREIKDGSGNYDELLRQKNELDELHQAKMAEWDERYTNETAKLEHQVQVMKEEGEKALAEADEQVQAAEAKFAKLKGTMDDEKQRHNDEVYGLRTRYKNEIGKLDGELKETVESLEQTRSELDEERREHDETKQSAAQIPQLEGDLEDARNTISNLEGQVSELKADLADHEERVVKAYEKIKGDEKVKEKARKAVEIAFTLLADQVSEDEVDDADINVDPDEAHT